MIRKFAMAFFIFFSSICAATNTLKDEQEVMRLAEKAMAKTANGDYSGAMKIFSQYSSASETELLGFAFQLKSYREKNPGKFGLSTSYEYVNETRLGKSLWRIVFLEKGAEVAQAWKLTCYKSPNGWIITSIDINGDTSKEF